MIGKTRAALLAVAAAAAALCAALGAGPVGAAPTIDIRVSVKVIRQPVTQNRPPVDTVTLAPVTDAKINAVFDIANDSLLTMYWRGYRLQVVEIFDIGSCGASCDSSNPGFWYNASFPGTYDMKRFEHWAKLYPAFLWRTGAINVYINAGMGNGAVASFPPPDNRSNDVVFVGGLVLDPAFRRTWAPATIHHELGHYFGLPHPNGTVEECCNPATCITDGDGIEDTLPDGPCFTLDQLSTQRYGQPFSGVNAAKQDSLLNMFWNNMCYLHPDQGGKNAGFWGFGQTLLDRLTELQLDRWTDTANGARANVLSAKTRFVQPSPCGICPPATGTSTDPFRNIPEAVNAAGSGDILLMRPGIYTGISTIDLPVTLRATRKGTARITN